MSIFEYDEEREKELLKRAYLEEGRQVGEELGEARGREEGRELGRQSGRVESILTLLAELGDIPEELKESICAQQDSEILKAWLKLAAKSESLEWFCQEMRRL